MKRSSCSIEYKGIEVECEYSVCVENYGADADGNRGQKEAFLDHLVIKTSEYVDTDLFKEIFQYAKRTIKEEALSC